MSTAESAFDGFEPTLLQPSRAPVTSFVTRASLLAFALMVISTCGRTATLKPAAASTFASGDATMECNGIGFPDHTQVRGTRLTLNGLGLLTVSTFKIRLYVAALYVVEPSNDARAILDSSAPNEIIIQFIRGVSASELRKSLAEELARNSPERSPALEEGLQQLRSWAVDVKSGQRIVFIRTPGIGMEVDINGTVKGSIAGDDFAKSFLSMWLGDDPQAPELKRELLGAPCGSSLNVS